MAELKKRLLSRVMAKKMYTGHVHSSTFNVSVYAPCHSTRLTILIDLPGKRASRAERRERSGKNTLKGTLRKFFTFVCVTVCSILNLKGNGEVR